MNSKEGGIVMCINTFCELKEECRRYNPEATPDNKFEYYISYEDDDGIIDCHYFLEDE